MQREYDIAHPTDLEPAGTKVWRNGVKREVYYTGGRKVVRWYFPDEAEV